MSDEIKEEYEFCLYENEYYNKKVSRVRKKYAKKTQLFSVALADEIELLIEEDKVLMKKILGLENREADKAEQEAKKKKSNSKSVKKTFREISLQTHPDRLLDADEEEAEEKQQLFRRAKESLENDNINELIEVAKELNIEPPEPDQHQIDLLKEGTSRLEEEIKTMKESVAWQWDLAKGNNKIAIVKNYMIYLSRVYKDKI